ncbi:MAG TPA: biotin/lipoate A/B protein ligase family protein [candidate division Zixibacteria bacterium]|nr:biotin/lipoate A/B protein ligase family protein [candidate division Zixibacteria bacterium]
MRLETHDAFMNMAIDEAILTARIEGRATDTLRYFSWKPSAVSIGKFQRVENEVQLENCKQRGIDVVRRITGGGAVYHDAEDEITYSLVASRESLKAGSIADVYERIYTGLTRALGILGVAADFNEGSAKACPNLTVKGRKISGSAQCHRREVVLQHGTILANVNLEKMFTYLRVPWAESCMQVVSIARRKITSLHDELGENVSPAELVHALEEGFGQALDVKIVSGALTPRERQLAEKLLEQKYATTDWNLHGRSSS